MSEVVTVNAPAIGVAIQASDAATAVARIEAAEKAGIDSVWMTLGRVRFDPLTAFSAAAFRTKTIGLGTAVLPTWPRHPLAVAQQVIALESLAPGRIRLGVGPSTAAAMRPFGITFEDPLDHLREYLMVLKAFLQDGSVDHSGRFWRARARLDRPLHTPVLGSALSAAAFTLCGGNADGVISWMCPPDYIADVGLPALATGARDSGRSVPPLVLHVPVVVGTEGEAVIAAQREVGPYLGFSYYKWMFARSGFPKTTDGLTPDVVRRLVVFGDADAVASRLVELTALGEVMAMPLSGGGVNEEAIGVGFDAIGRASRSMREAAG